MKKFVLLLLAMASISYAAANDSFHADKYYVEPGSIHVAPNGIFLIVEGQLYAVQSLETDENGVYIPSPQADGICGKHGRYFGSGGCPKCAAERGKKKK